MAFREDGSTLASCGNDGVARLWTRAADGWAALSPDGRYKLEGDAAGQFWHAIGTCRFETGELDDYLTQVRRLAVDAPF